MRRLRVLSDLFRYFQEWRDRRADLPPKDRKLPANEVFLPAEGKPRFVTDCFNPTRIARMRGNRGSLSEIERDHVKFCEKCHNLVYGEVTEMLPPDGGVESQ